MSMYSAIDRTPPSRAAPCQSTMLPCCGAECASAAHNSIVTALAPSAALRESPRACCLACCMSTAFRDSAAVSKIAHQACHQLQIPRRVDRVRVMLRRHHPQLHPMLQDAHHVDGLGNLQRRWREAGVLQEKIPPERDDANLLAHGNYRNLRAS